MRKMGTGHYRGSLFDLKTILALYRFAANNLYSGNNQPLLEVFLCFRIRAFGFWRNFGFRILRVFS